MWMQNTIRFEDVERLGQCDPGMQPPPRSGMTHPVDVEMVRPHPVETGEGCIELLATIARYALSDSAG